MRRLAVEKKIFHLHSLVEQLDGASLFDDTGQSTNRTWVNHLCNIRLLVFATDNN